jgi:hypothetical protein
MNSVMFGKRGLTTSTAINIASKKLKRIEKRLTKSASKTFCTKPGFPVLYGEFHGNFPDVIFKKNSCT